MTRPPLQLSQLREIQDRNLRNADVKALLWEIRRLRNVVWQVSENHKIIRREWSHEVGSRFVAIEQTHMLLQDEDVIHTNSI
ncbi:hypothetical protein [Alcaligenes aquatilis]|uniref:hypothetical protein n=1 Tax=Alcaligenes aquatilis TaxID=323284 RepID=UPI0036145178